MPDKDAGTPRVFLVRHGETEWSKTGRFTGITDVHLTQNGREQVVSAGKVVVGKGKLIDPSKLARVFVSPRERAQATYALLFEHVEQFPKPSITELLAEWGYGQYEGLLTSEIRARRKDHGLDKESPWDIWRDGCEDGEMPQQITARIDMLFKQINDMQINNMHGERPADVMLIAHGHILRAFAKRWLGYPMEFSLSTMIEPGGIATLSYQHHNIEEPALVLGARLS